MSSDVRYVTSLFIISLMIKAPLFDHALEQRYVPFLDVVDV